MRLLGLTLSSSCAQFVRSEMHLAAAGSSGLASSTVALKLSCAFDSSGLERMGLESGGLRDWWANDNYYFSLIY